MTLEDTLRRLLDEAAPEPPGTSAPPLSAPAARRSYLPLLAAAVVAALVVAVFVGRAAWPHRHALEQAVAPTATAAATPPPAVDAPGMQAVSYYGISLRVPVSWRVSTLGCASYPRASAVFTMLENVRYSCPAQVGPAQSKPDPAFTTVIVGAYHPSYSHAALQRVRIDGVAASRTTRILANGATGSLVVPSRQASVTVVAPTVAQVRAVLDTVGIDAFDQRGCGDRPDPLTAITNAAASQLVPGSPVSAVACGYDAADSTYRLVGSRTLTPAQIGRLQTHLGVGSVGAANGPPSSVLRARYQFRYADGTTRVIDASLDLFPATVTDGRRTATTTADLPNPLP